MAIGNAPWPIGVTMVGIHARTGREKIFAQQIAHVLNDETQRKYIQVSDVGAGIGGGGSNDVRLNEWILQVYFLEVQVIDSFSKQIST